MGIDFFYLEGAGGVQDEKRRCYRMNRCLWGRETVCLRDYVLHFVKPCAREI